MERRLGNDHTMTYNAVALIGLRKCPTVAALMVFATMASASAQNFGERPVRYGYTSGHYFDSRNDDRDFPNNGFFPGNFAAAPIFAAIGAAGFLESNPRRSAKPYPSQTYFAVVRSNGRGAVDRP